MSAAHQKVTASHLSRDAYLYVRQSSLRQVFEHGESTRRQYALRERAVALGWPSERIVVIDSDLGLSGADSDREGFQRLVAEAGMGRAGIVLGLEVSRLARSSTDWHKLLEICALSETLILDEDAQQGAGRGQRAGGGRGCPPAAAPGVVPKRRRHRETSRHRCGNPRNTIRYRRGYDRKR